jgi:hypothetical protein
MELWLGPSHRGSAFGSREELEQAWVTHRDRLMALWGKHGQRPAAWWEFEAPFPRPYKRERSKLYEAGLLDEVERAELETWWREQYLRAWDPHFFHCEGPGRLFSGAVGRRKHYAWADIPTELVKKWSAEYRRRSRIIRRIKVTKEPHEEDVAGL